MKNLTIMNNNMNAQFIAFFRGKVLVASEAQEFVMGSDRIVKLLSLTEELKRLGFHLSPSVISNITEEQIEEMFASVVPYLVEQRHADNDGSFEPLYPGFPKQVISMSQVELWKKQCDMYAQQKDGTFDEEKFKIENRWYPEEIEWDGYKETFEILDSLSEKEFMKIPYEIMASGNSLDARVRNELLWYLRTYPNLELPESIPFKETLVLVATERKDLKFKDINDVCRYGCSLMGMSPDLPSVPKTIWKTEINRKKRRRICSKVENPNRNRLHPLTRAERRDIMERIEAIEKPMKFIIPDARREYGHWLILASQIHPGEYKNKYPKAYEFFDTLRNRKKSYQYRSWNSVVQAMYENSPIEEIAEKVSERPGEFVRRFDSLLRRSEESDEKVLDIFFDTEGMRSKTLLELMNYYEKRLNDVPRVIQLKGKGGRKQLKTLPAMSKDRIDTIKDVIKRKIFNNIISAANPEEFKGKTVIMDSGIYHLPIAQGMRNSEISMPRGTRLPIPEDVKAVRFFLHWIDTDNSQDLDIHADLMSEDFETTEHIGFNGKPYLMEGDHEPGIVFSGDVRQGLGNRAEYIDVNFEEAKALGYRYVTILADNFENRNLCSLQSWFGFLYMTKPLAPVENTNWCPKDPVFSEKFTAESRTAIEFIIDLETKEAIVADSKLNVRPGVDAIFESILTTQLLTFVPPFNCGDVIKAYYEARGAQVIESSQDDHIPCEDDIVITLEGITKDYIKVLAMLGK